MHYFFNIIAVICFSVFCNISIASTDSFPSFSYENSNEEALSLYNAIDFNNFEKPAFDVFYYAITGYQKLAQHDKALSQDLITLIDFRKPSSEKRLWVINIKKQKAIYHTLVAHGRNSGDLFARNFSNKNNSHQSSLGFYRTGNTYIGKHGLSLKLHGLEEGINDHAEARAIVMHGADYVSESFVQKVGRLGRSFGCPAVPSELHKQIINQIAGGSCLFIYFPDQDYLKTTRLFPKEMTAGSQTTGSF